jgi:hypothetical protein
MHCPEHLIAQGKWFQIWHHQSADMSRKYISIWEKLNPLRYEVCIGPGPGRFWHLNNDAAAHLWVRNLRWKITRLCWLRGHEWRELNSFQKPTMMCDRCMKQRPAEY